MPKPGRPPTTPATRAVHMPSQACSPLPCTCLQLLSSLVLCKAVQACRHHLHTVHAMHPRACRAAHATALEGSVQTHDILLHLYFEFRVHKLTQLAAVGAQAGSARTPQPQPQKRPCLQPLCLRGLGLGLAQGAVQVGKRGAHKQEAANGVAQRDGQDVVQERLRPGDVGAHGHAQGDEEHVGHRVLQANGDEGGNGRPQAHHLAGQRGGGGRVPHRHAHQPVAQDGADEDERQRQGHGLHGGHAHGHGVAGQHAGGVHGGHGEQGANKVAGPRPEPVVQHAAQRGLLLVHRHGDDGCVAGEQLCARQDHHGQADGEDEATDQLDQAGHGGHQALQAANHRHEQEAAQADVAASQEARDQQVGNRLLGLLGTDLHEVLVGLGGCIHAWNGGDVHIDLLGGRSIASAVPVGAGNWRV
mmetsp:Transcript_22614/g.57525  ORF Transcript_22614/g.57525 Transcript_22614/m.57525 type:complete len:416 (+) Transcript_22614:614-1861(+)